MNTKIYNIEKTKSYKGFFFIIINKDLDIIGHWLYTCIIMFL